TGFMRELLTSRLRLRGFRQDDLAALVAMNRDPEVMRYIRAVGSEEEETRKAAALISDNQDKPLGIWAVEGRDDGCFHGAAMLICLPEGDDIEVGYRLVKAAWGRGLATEAALCLRDHGFEELGLEEIVAVADPGNTASHKVLRKIGLSFRGLRRAYGVDGLHFFGLTRGDWQGLRGAGHISGTGTPA
ncbi:MAG: GNAT family N-acetyltransferase, partial [Kiloniellales bacterium]|nr:GNAT family N-acetyltransferase [Kiloniellales bacterium]